MNEQRADDWAACPSCGGYGYTPKRHLPEWAWPQCESCEISLRYTGGMEHVVTRTLSMSALLLAAVLEWRRRRRESLPCRRGLIGRE